MTSVSSSRLKLPRPRAWKGGGGVHRPHCTTLQQKAGSAPREASPARQALPRLASEVRSKNNLSPFLPMTGPAPIPRKCHGKSSPRIPLRSHVGKVECGSSQHVCGHQSPKKTEIHRTSPNDPLRPGQVPDCRTLPTNSINPVGNYELQQSLVPIRNL